MCAQKSSANPLLQRVRELEQQLFGDALDPADIKRMRSAEYSWLYRPSHHIKSGLLTEQDVQLLCGSGTLLSMGGHSGYLERILVELGVPAEHILIADNDPMVRQAHHDIPAVVMDMHEPWPVQGLFDRIIFPESLCISITDSEKPNKTDEEVAVLLAAVIKQALDHLKPNGVIRANGPMYHPNIVTRMSEILEKNGHAHRVAYNRFLMSIMAK